MAKKSVKLWECQDCGKLTVVDDKERKPNACWCCVDMEGEYHGKNEKNDFIVITGFYKTKLKDK